jgi:uncharacterized protein
MRVLYRFVAITGAFLALFFILPIDAALAQQPVHFDREPLIIRKSSGEILKFNVEVAATNQQRQRGLMFRKRMASDEGMLFDFGSTRRVTMWMQNTELSLDMLFVDSGGIIRTIRRNAVPFSRDIIDSEVDVRYVIELNAGVVERLRIATGDGAVSASMKVK